MSKTIVIEPTQNLVDAIVSLIKRDSADWSDVALVFPGKRPAHFVRKALGIQCGHSYVPPRIFSIDEFIDYLYCKKGASSSKGLEPIDAVALLFQIHREIKERVGASNFNTLDAFFPVGQKLLGELEELCIANLSTKQIEEVLKPISYGRLHVLADYYNNFYRLVGKQGYATRSMKYREVASQADNIDLAEFSSVIVTGFLALTKSEQQIFGELRRRDNTIFVYQQGHGLRQHFERLKIAEESGKISAETRPEISLYEAQDTHGQVFALSTLLNETLRRGEPVNEKSVIVLPTADALFPLYHHTLPLLEAENYNIALGYPLARTPVYGFLNNLMDLVGAKQGNRFPASAYLKFVLHPYSKNIRLGNRSDITRILFHKLEESIAGDTSKMFVTLDELESLDEVFTSIPFNLDDDSVTAEQLKGHLALIHNNTIRRFDSFRSIGDFAKKAIELLLFVYDQSTANLHPLFRECAESLLESLHEIELSLLSGERFDSVDGYFNFLKRYIATKEVPFTGTPLHGLQVLGLLETRNLQFDEVYVLDVNDDVIPGGIGQEMMLPQGLREKLGLETYKSREQLVEYHFGLLLRGAKKAHLFYTETGKSEKSRFVEKILWERQKREGFDSAKQRTNVIRYNLKLANPTPEPVGKTPEVAAFLRNSSFNASGLDTYLRCPLRFYYSHVIKMEEKEEAGEDVDQQEIGKFVHLVLRKYYSVLIGKELAPDMLDLSRLEVCVNEQFKEDFGDEDAGTLYLFKRQVSKQLKAFLQLYQIPLLAKNNVVIEALEETIQIPKWGFHIEGRLDRIERRGNEVFILDYKTGKDDSYIKINFKKLNVESRETWSEAIGSLQLPFYMFLFTEKNNIDMRRIHPAYLFLGRNNLDKEIETEFAEDPAERVERFDLVKQVIASLMEEIVSVEIPFNPTPDLQKNCPGCPFTVVCGTQWIGGSRQR